MVNYNIRMNVMNINSIKSFAGIKGRFNSGTKDVYFLEVNGVNNTEEMTKQIYDMDYKFENNQGYFRENRIKDVLIDDIHFYLSSYENNSFQIKFKMNNELYSVYISAIEKIKKLFIENTSNSNDTILKNFIVKIMFWSDYYFPKIFNLYDINSTYKFVLCGNTKKTEYMFLYFLAFMGVDILYLDYEKKKNFEIKTNYKPSVVYYDKIEKLNLDSFNNAKINNDVKHENTKPNKTVTNVKNQNDNLSKPVINNTETKKELDFEEISKFAVKVVMISVLNQNGECFKTGSGFFAGKNGIILTNFHVIQGGAMFAVRMENDENVFLTNEIIKYDYSRDMAILRIENNVQPLSIYNGKSELVRGQKVAAIGSPLGLFNSVSDGIISGFRNIDDNDFIQFTAPVSHGSSGGALFNMQGQVIGIITAGYDGGQNINLAVSYKVINNFIKGFIN